MNSNLPSTGWYLDPAGLSDGRYWDGAEWTAVVTRSGLTSTVPIDPTRAAVPPLPGTAIQPPVTASTASTTTARPGLKVAIGVMAVLLVALLAVAIIGNTGSDESPPDITDPPATAPPAAEPADGGG